MSIYNAELSAGSLLVSESRLVAELLLDKPDLVAWKKAIKEDNLLQKNTPATSMRLAKLIRNRLENLDDEGLILIVEGSPEIRTQMLLLAAIRHSRLLGDFMIDVYRGRQNRLDKELNITDWDTFLHECEQRDPTICDWSEKTRTKLLQVLLRILAEAKYIASTRTLRLTPPLLHPRVLRYIAQHGDRYISEAMELTR